MTEPLTKSCTACRTDINVAATRCPACTQRQPDTTGLYRDLPAKAAGGVCAALAQRYDWDVTLVRVLFVASLAVTGPLVFWVYAALWALTPFDRGGRAPLVRFFDGVARVFSPPPPAVARLDDDLR